jgi:hypothetical protein
MENDIKIQSLQIREEVESFIINTQADVDFINERVKAAEKLKKTWWDKYDPVCKKAKAAHTENVKNRDEVCKPLRLFIELWKGRIGIFDYKQKQEAQRKEEAINTRLREKAAKEAAEAAKQAKQDNVAPPPVAEPIQIVVMPTVEKPIGMTIRTTYHAEVVNFAALSDEYKVVNQQMIDGFARLHKDGAKLPGIKFYVKVNGVRVDEPRIPAPIPEVNIGFREYDRPKINMEA